MSERSAVAVVQFAPRDDTGANLAAITEHVERAVARGASLVVLPEYSAYFTPQPGPDWLEAAQGLGGEFVAALGALAQQHGIHLVAGFLETSPEPERIYNTVAAVGPDGTLLATYRKQHLYDAFGSTESQWVAPGALTAPQTFPWRGFTVGLQTCYDIRFPEVTRALVDAGADLVLVPAEWVRGPLKEFHWRTLVTARAIENTVFVAAADHAPPIGVGNSLIVDPMGVALASLGEAPDVAVADLDPARLAEVRAVNPALELRRYRVSPRQ